MNLSTRTLIVSLLPKFVLDLLKKRIKKKLKRQGILDVLGFIVFIFEARNVAVIHPAIPQNGERSYKYPRYFYNSMCLIFVSTKKRNNQELFIK